MKCRIDVNTEGEVMSAVSPKEVDEAIKKVSETIANDSNIDEVITAFAELGIQIKNPDDGTFKSWYDILEEMSEIWERSSLKMNSKWHMYISFVKSAIRISRLCVLSYIQQLVNLSNWFGSRLKC